MSGILGWVRRIAESIGNLAENLAGRIKDIIVEIFIPSEDYLSNKWESIRNRFGFADSITETGDIIIRFFKETAFNEPPKVYIDLGKAESDYNYGGQTYCLDMSWYERYKPIVDPFLSAWMWLVFCYGVYTKLPAIISGSAGHFEAFDGLNRNSEYVKWHFSQKRGGRK